ncbi:hypothetical protein EG329_002712 [Mollisiaceae sp. DMI_Dod_QoI]|nr:hypothetical protein EG329_002712 [Helotiales sp. DMI_Dod_QoI]
MSCITPVKPIYRSERIQVQKPAQPSTRLQAQPNDQRPQNGRVLEPIVILRSPKKIPRLRNPPERAYFTAARSKPATPKGSVLTKIRAISKQTYKGRQSPPVRAYFAGSASSPAPREDSAMADNMTAATKSVPPTRQGTPLSPLSEELFGDILDSKLPTVPLRWFSDSSYSEEEIPEAKIPYARSRGLRPNTTPDVSFGDKSSTAANEADVFDSVELTPPNNVFPPGIITVGREDYHRSVLFCSSSLVNLGHGGILATELGAQDTIAEFVIQITTKSKPLILKPIFEALSEARFIVEVKTTVRINLEKTVADQKQTEEKDVELSRYFLPSRPHGNKYVEIHAKDVCDGLSPARADLGQMKHMSPYSILTCDCRKVNFGAHDPCLRTVTLLKNHLRRASFVGRLPRIVTGEWMVGGNTKQWGIPLEEAKAIWQKM